MHHPPKTATSNLAQHTQAISFASLPRSFQEAVVFVRKLGFRYLWIDSLCIVQDDDSDKLDEIRRMCDIFRGATLTIAISKARNSTEGCFTRAAPVYKGFEFKDYRDSTLLWTVRRRPDHPNRISQGQQSFPLLCRRWFLQEYLLSRRLLHFGPQELQWTGRAMTACECGVSRSSFLQRFQRYEEKGFNWMVWYKLVTDYTKLNLTMEGDRLERSSRSYQAHRLLSVCASG